MSTKNRITQKIITKQNKYNNNIKMNEKNKTKKVEKK